MLIHMCLKCGVCHDGDCKPVRKTKPRKAVIAKRGLDISMFPKAMQEQIRAKLNTPDN